MNSPRLLSSRDADKECLAHFNGSFGLMLAWSRTSLWPFEWMPTIVSRLTTICYHTLISHLRSCYSLKITPSVWIHIVLARLISFSTWLDGFESRREHE